MTKVKDSPVEFPPKRMESPIQDRTKHSATERMESSVTALLVDKIKRLRDTTKNVHLKPRMDKFTGSQSNNSTFESEIQNDGIQQDSTRNYGFRTN